MGTTQSVISRLEEGGGARNRLDTLARVATALDRHLVVSFPDKVPVKLKDDAVQVGLSALNSRRQLGRRRSQRAATAAQRFPHYGDDRNTAETRHRARPLRVAAISAAGASRLDRRID